MRLNRALGFDDTVADIDEDNEMYCLFAIQHHLPVLGRVEGAAIVSDHVILLFRTAEETAQPAKTPHEGMKHAINGFVRSTLAIVCPREWRGRIEWTDSDPTSAASLMAAELTSITETTLVDWFGDRGTRTDEPAPSVLWGSWIKRGSTRCVGRPASRI